MLAVVPFSGIIALIVKGEEWRKKLGSPQFHQDI